MTRTEAAYRLINSSSKYCEHGMTFLSDMEFTGEELEKYRQLVNDGYTLWLDGGECPVDEGVRVDVVCNRNGRHDGFASEFNWGMLIAYRVAGEETKDDGAFVKVAHYTDKTGTDLIDDFARHRTPEQLRGAMMFVIEKYMRRCGKKDDIKDEVYKIADYANRWLEYERKLK